ncbi:MAG: hypothetical protein CMM33_04830 [Rhodospirillaceae bacterium]|nr:hypothetical protein [Rhodospirillaceae bacterium]
MSDPNSEISQTPEQATSRAGSPTQKAAALAVLLLVAVGWFFLHNKPSPPQPDASSEERASIPPDRPSEPSAPPTRSEEATATPVEETVLDEPEVPKTTANENKSSADNETENKDNAEIKEATEQTGSDTTELPPTVIDQNQESADAETSSDTVGVSPTVIDRNQESPNGETSPSFDIVTVSPDGETVLAGRAEPGATVTIRVNGDTIGSVLADNNGEWVFVPQTPLSEGARELELVATNKSGKEVYSEKVVVIIVPGDTTVAGKSTTNATANPVAVLMSRDGQGLDRLLQGKELAEGLTAGQKLTLDILNYDAKGQVDFSGKGLPDGEIRAYINNQLVGIAKVNPDGSWQLVPNKKIDTGLYNLRIDQLDLAGKVISRLETPFSMASFERPAAGEGLVVVQPGNSLWRIARRLYGKGVRYTMIFVANQDQIKDPSLIYPGQIFIVPEEG